MTPKDPLIGKTLEKCRLLEKLGTGGMGSVYLAEHFGLGRKVAVKILPPDMSRDPEYVARFMREATTAGRLEHPNIVQIYDVGYAEDRHFIVMQFVEGESLSTAVEALGAMEPRDAARVAAGVLRGLHHAHEHGVVHRDVKPDNILLAKGDQPKLLDFGLAIETEGALQLTKDGLVVGTPYYLSPEQARGQRATPKSDVYAAGVLLYFLVTGKRPFVGATALAVLNKHIREKPVPPMSQNSKIPKALNDIILKMMSKRPDDRYSTAAAAADDLENYLADRPVTARIAEAPPWLTPQVRIAGLSAAGFLAIVATLALTARACRGPATTPTTSTGTATTGPGPAVEPPPIGNLEGAVALDVEKRDTPAAWREILKRYDTFILANQGTSHADRARSLRARFTDEMEIRARKAVEELPPDPVGRLKALDALPDEIVSLTSAGERVRAERARLADVLRKRYVDQKVQLDRCVEENDFDTARALISEMSNYADPDRKKALASLLADLAERERRHNNQTLRRLAQEYTRVHGWFEEALIRRDTEAAYRHLTEFLAGHRDSGERALLRVENVNYDGLLLALALNSTLDADLLAQARAAVDLPWARAENTLPYEILADLQDALDLGWLLRRAGTALKTLSAPDGGEVSLSTFGGAGRVTIGLAGYLFQPKAGPEKPISVAGLEPADLALLAAMVENQTVDSAYQTNAPLARAAGVGYLYSAAADRWSSAARWLTRASELKAPMPAGRPEAVRELGRRQVREQLTLVQKDVVQRRYEAVKKALNALEVQAGKDKELLDEVGSVGAAVLSAEIREAFEGRSHARVKELTRLLRGRYAGLYEEETIEGLYRRSLWETKNWLRVNMEFKGGFWDWEGKAQGAPPPASFEAHDGIRLPPGKRLFVNPARAGELSGLAVQVRLNAEAKSFAVGFHFDIVQADGKYRMLILTPNHVGFGEGSVVGSRFLHAAPPKKKPVRGEWIDLALLAEGDDVVGYLGNEPAVGFRGRLSPGGRIALAADVDASFRAVQVRK